MVSARAVAIRSCSLMRAISSLASAAARRSLSSRVNLAKPRSLPAPSHSGVMITLAQNWLPSRRTRQPSVTTRPSATASRSSWSGDTGFVLVWRVEDGEMLAD